MLYDFVTSETHSSLNMNSDLHDIVQDVHRQVYSKPYPNGAKRVIHDINHISRAIVLGTAGYNMMNSVGIEGMDKMSPQEKENELKLLQIGLLLHDSGCENDLKDTFDEHSGLNVYHYLINRLGVDSKTAGKVAEAVANKDWRPGLPYSRLILNEAQAPRFETQDRKDELSQDLDRLRLAIQYGDCIDYLRTENEFDMEYLLLFQKHNITNEKVNEITWEIIYENKRLLKSYWDQKETGSRRYGTEHSYESVIEDLGQEISPGIKRAPVIQGLYNDGKQGVIETEPLLARSDDIVDGFFQLNLLYRGVTGCAEKFERNRMVRHEINGEIVESSEAKEYSPNYSGGEHEIRKLHRLPEVETTASTPEKRLGKSGNPTRSTTLLGRGGELFTGVGGAVLIKNPLNENKKVKILRAATDNIYSGGGKKKEFAAQLKSEGPRDIEAEMKSVRKKLQSGEKNGHNEIIADMYGWDCIVYSPEEPKTDSRSSSLRVLEAIYLRDVYEKYYGEVLPIYEISLKNGYCIKKQVTNDLIVDVFKQALSDEVSKRLLDAKKGDPNSYEAVYSIDLDDLITSILGKYNLIKISAFWTNDLSAMIKQMLISEKRRLLEKNTGPFVVILLNKFSAESDNVASRANIDNLMNLYQKNKDYHSLIESTVSDWLNSDETKKNPITPNRLNDFYKLMRHIKHWNENDISAHFNEYFIKKLSDFIQKNMKGNDIAYSDIEKMGIDDLVEMLEKGSPIQQGEHCTQSMIVEMKEKLKLEKNRLLQEFIKSYDFNSSIINNATVDRNMDILLSMANHNIYKTSAIKLISYQLNGLLSYSNDAGKKERTNKLIECAKNNLGYGKLIAEEFTLWLKTSEYKRIPYNQLDKIVKLWIALNVRHSAENHKRFFKIIKSGVNDYIDSVLKGGDPEEISRLKAMTADDLGKHLFGESYDPANSDYKIVDEIIAMTLKENLEVINAAAPSTSDTQAMVMSDKFEPINYENLAKIDAYSVVAYPVSEVNKASTAILSQLRALEGIPVEKLPGWVDVLLILAVKIIDVSNEQDINIVKSILSEKAQKTDMFSKMLISNVLDSAIVAGKMELFTILFEKSGGDAKNFIQALQYKDVSIEHVPAILGLCKDENTKKELSDNILVRILEAGNIEAAQKIMNEPYASIYLTKASMSVKHSKGNYTPLNYALMNLADERDPEKCRIWYKVADSLFRNGAMMGEFSHLRQIKRIASLQDKNHASRLLYYILQSTPKLLELCKTSVDKTHYISWCMQANYASGLVDCFKDSPELLQTIFAQQFTTYALNEKDIGKQVEFLQQISAQLELNSDHPMMKLISHELDKLNIELHLNAKRHGTHPGTTVSPANAVQDAMLQAVSKRTNTTDGEGISNDSPKDL